MGSLAVFSVNDIIPASSRPYQITPTGLLLSDVITFEEWAQCGQELWGLKQAVQWAVGDWLLAGERKFGERYAQALDETRYSYGSLRNIAWVAGQFPREHRQGSLSWSHHMAVAGVDEPARFELLDRALDEGYTRDELRMEVKQLKSGDDATDVQIVEPLPAVRVEALVEDCSTLLLHIPLKPEWVGKEVMITIKEAA